MTQDARPIPHALLEGVVAHQSLDAWLKSEALNAALKAMGVSSVSKKPGRVVQRLEKALGAMFATPRVLKWEKADKNVYTSARSIGEISDVAMPADPMPVGQALFQTDVYFRDNRTVTEVNASTVSAISLPAVAGLLALRPEESAEQQVQAALSLTRIFQTGFKDTGLPVTEVRRYLVPNGPDAMVVLSLPIRRIDLGEDVVGQVAIIVDWRAAADLTQAEREDLSVIAQAMTRAGHPGAEAFGQMLAARAEPVATPRPEGGI